MDAKKTEILFTIAPDGSIELEVQGVKGADCVALTEAIEEALGVVVDRQKTSEYYEDETTERRTIVLGEDA